MSKVIFPDYAYELKPFDTFSNSDTGKTYLVVNDETIREAVLINRGKDRAITHKGRQYTFSDSDSTIFTGLVTDMSFLFFEKPMSWESSIYDDGFFEGSWQDKAERYILAKENKFNLVFDYSDSHNFTRSFEGDISHWDVSGVKNMEAIFSGIKFFRLDVGEWDVSSVTNMRGAFSDIIHFNSDITKWDVSSCKDMSYMFAQAVHFSQDISRWNTSNVKNMEGMFFGAVHFEPDLIKAWDFDNVLNMSGMFFNSSRAYNLNGRVFGTSQADVSDFSGEYKHPDIFIEDLQKEEGHEQSS